MGKRIACPLCIRLTLRIIAPDELRDRDGVLLGWREKLGGPIEG